MCYTYFLLDLVYEIRYGIIFIPSMLCHINLSFIFTLEALVRVKVVVMQNTHKLSRDTLFHFRYLSIITLYLERENK